MWTLIITVIIMLLNSSSFLLCNEMSDVTSDVFEEKSGLLAAFGDFNSDKFTDVFRISSDRRTVDVLLGAETKPYLRKSSIKCEMDEKSVITSVMPSDFDGDSMMDILVTVTEKESGSDTNDVRILWGRKKDVNCSGDTHFTMIGQPLVMDYDGDMIPDLFGMNEKSELCVWMFNQQRNFSVIKFGSNKMQKLSLPHSCAFIDLDGDTVADLFLTGEESIEYWINKQGTFVSSLNVSYPEGIAHRGQVSFADINLDGNLEKILPICNDTDCLFSSIVVWSEKKWVELFSDFQLANATWGFQPLGKKLLDRSTLAITLRVADFNMDGYPDFLGIVQSKNSPTITKAVLFLNVKCSKCPLGRTLQADLNVANLKNLNDVQLATFYDIFGNGKMDILLGSYSKGEWQLNALQNTFSYDAYFIKVLVLNGLCYSDCPDGNIPYGTNQPGSVIEYHTTETNGNKRRSSAGQLSQSAYFSLQLPYTVFGLGETPNFVDKLFITIPGFTDKKKRAREWQQIIPNSQMVVIPHPPENPHKWINKLFVTPSGLVLLTLLALVGTCVFICLIIGLLHWKEKREDRREKLQEAHRFHFDAM